MLAGVGIGSDWQFGRNLWWGAIQMWDAGDVWIVRIARRLVGMEGMGWRGAVLCRGLIGGRLVVLVIEGGLDMLWLNKQI